MIQPNRSKTRHKLTLEAQVHGRVILEVSTNTWSINQSVDIKRLEQILRSNATELQQTWSVDGTGCHNDVARSNEPGSICRVAAMNLNASSSSAVALENDLRTIVPHKQMQVGAIADGLVVGRSCRRSLACDAADCLCGPDETGVVAICAIACIGGVQVGNPGLSLKL